MTNTPSSPDLRLQEIRNRVNEFAFNMRLLDVKEAQSQNRDASTLLSLVDSLQSQLSAAQGEIAALQKFVLNPSIGTAGVAAPSTEEVRG
jgi:hypothetical protein